MWREHVHARGTEQSHNLTTAPSPDPSVAFCHTSPDTKRRNRDKSVKENDSSAPYWAHRYTVFILLQPDTASHRVVLCDAVSDRVVLRSVTNEMFMFLTSVMRTPFDPLTA